MFAALSPRWGHSGPVGSADFKAVALASLRVGPSKSSEPCGADPGRPGATDRTPSSGPLDQHSHFMLKTEPCTLSAVTRLDSDARACPKDGHGLLLGRACDAREVAAEESAECSDGRDGYT